MMVMGELVIFVQFENFIVTVMLVRYLVSVTETGTVPFIDYF